MTGIGLPAATSDQLRTFYHLLATEYRITPGEQVERAGRALAQLAQIWLDDDLADRPVVVLAGRGANGWGGLAAALQLLDLGAWVQIILSHPPSTYPPSTYLGGATEQLAKLQARGATLAWAEEGWELPPADLVIDALIGCGLHGEPNGHMRDLIQLANSSLAPVLSLAAPSGLSIETGELYQPHVQAAATIALGLPSTALVEEPGHRACGELYLAAIGAPPVLYARLGLPSAPFAHQTLTRVEVVDGKVRVG
jgi:NAD(P)H-hydrate epimerase